MADVLGFPDAPRSELERSIEELIAHGQRVLATQERLRQLLGANRVVVEHLELDSVLTTIVEAAVTLSGARYGALGVVSPTGGLEQFIHVGMPSDAVALIGHLPEGRGILGAVIDTAEPIRLEHLGQDPRSVGFPDHHPPMDAFLGVPVVVRGEVFGDLYLTEKSGGPFSAEDEEVVASLAATAGIAIDNARLYAESRRRERWNAALAGINAVLLSGEVEDPLAVVVESAASAVDSELVSLVRPLDGGQLFVQLARGEGADAYQGTVIPGEGTVVARAIESGAPVVVDRAGEDGDPVTAALGPAVAVPLVAEGRTAGALTVIRPLGSPRFTTAEVEMAGEFARQASIAIELARARRAREQLDLVEDRTRIARDLHDHVIQRLFGAGLSLQSVAALVPEPVAERIAEQVSAIDAAIAEIRTAIFTLESRRIGQPPRLRHRIVDVVAEIAEPLGFSPRLGFSGAVDLLVVDDLADDVVAVVREGLANVVRHAAARRADVRIEIDGELVRVLVEDDGTGIPDPAPRRSGTGNLAHRADVRGGTFALERVQPTGTRLLWSAPVEGKG